MSEKLTHGSLAEALAAFQEDAPTFQKRQTANVGSYTYKYADLGDILPKVNPLLAKHGLSWSGKPAIREYGMALTFCLRHVSGEVDEGEVPLGVPVGCRPQDLGSALTYMRRYAQVAHLNLATEADDDGASAQQAASKESNRPQPKAEAKPSETIVSAKQRGLLNGRADDAGLAPSEFASLIVKVWGGEPKRYDTEDDAVQHIQRLLDRFPAKYVNPLLHEIQEIGKVSAT